MIRKLPTFCTVAVLALVSPPVSAASTTPGASSEASLSRPGSDATGQAKGRYKKGGDNSCVWAANDSGPNQCTPTVKGRFKKGGNDSCTWDPNDVGDDQCRPAKGRWKKGGDNSCAWDPNDGGPDQCNPRTPR